MNRKNLMWIVGAVLPLLAVAGCSTKDPVAAAPATPSVAASSASPSPAAPPSPSPKPAVVALTPTSVAGVKVGASAKTLEATLTAALGKPAKVENSSFFCPLGGSGKQPRRALTWGGLTVWLANPGKPNSSLVKWEIHTGSLPSAITVPYGVTNADTVASAKAKIPGVKEQWDDVFQIYMLTTSKASNMIWGGQKADGSGQITYITSSFEPCD